MASKRSKTEAAATEETPAAARANVPASATATGNTAYEDIAAVVSFGRRTLAWTVLAGWSSGLLTRGDAILSTVPEAKDIERLIEDMGEPLPPPSSRPAEAHPGLVGAPRLSRLIEAIGAGPTGRDLLAVTLAVELDPIARQLAAYLRGGTGGVSIGVGTLMLGFGQDRVPELLSALGAGAPLRRHRLLELHERAGEILAAATVRAAPRLSRWLAQPGEMDAEVQDLVEVHLPVDEPVFGAAALIPVEAALEEVGAFLEKQNASKNPSDLVLRGARGSGRGEIIREACRLQKRPLLVADVATLLSRGDPGEAAALVLREVLLRDAQLLVRGGEAFAQEGAGTPTSHESMQRLRTALRASIRPVVITATEIDPQSLGFGRPLVVRSIPLAATHERESIWRELLPELDAGEIGSLYRVGVGAILRVAVGARLQADLRGGATCQASDLALAIRNEFASDLGAVATRVDVSQSWDDLVVADDTRRTVSELLNQLRHRSTVLGRWGFGKKLGKGLGTVALFSGEPGTGKSMVAGLIAADLGLELYQIDLSRVVSKWIGETEKNLAKLFDAAETGHVLLLFDEADALFGKRTADVKSSNDRNANLEVNYILQRLESFHGVAILTSNLASSIDPAFARRLSFELRFQFPDEEQRAQIWRRTLPVEAPVDDDIDFGELSTRFEISGGYIRNIVLRAAYLAATDGTALKMSHLLQAAEYEYRDHGMLVAKGRIKT